MIKSKRIGLDYVPDYRILTLKDLQDIPANKLPMPVVSESAFSLFGCLIVGHQRDFYSHSMWLYRPGWFATQGFTFSLKQLEPIAAKCRLKLFDCEFNQMQKSEIEYRIHEQLNDSWFLRRYDIVGVLGQLLGLRNLNIPYLNYCSERVGNDLASVFPGFQIKKPTPSDINRWCSKHLKIYGYYDPAMGL